MINMRSRRDLRALTAAAFAGCILLHACGGKHSTPSAALTAAERIAALETVRDQVAAANGRDPSAGPQAGGPDPRARPEVQDPGRSGAPGWRRRRDGRPSGIPR